MDRRWHKMVDNNNERIKQIEMKWNEWNEMEWTVWYKETRLSKKKMKNGQKPLKIYDFPKWPKTAKNDLFSQKCPL